MIYLASPYSHTDPSVRQERYEQVFKYTSSRMLVHKELIFSPIVYGHPFAEHGMEFDFSFWEHLDKHLILSSTAVRVLMLDGFRESNGIRLEVEFAALNGIPVSYTPYEISVNEDI